MAHAHDHQHDQPTEEIGSEFGREEGRDDGYGAVARTYYATIFCAVLFVSAMFIILVQ